MTIFDLLTRVLKSFEHRQLVPSSEGVVHSPKLQLLAGSPEVRDQELTGEEIPVDAGGGFLSRVRHNK